MFDFNKLLGRMKEYGYTQSSMAKELGVTENCFTNKIKGRSSFSSLEIKTMCNKLNIAPNKIGAYFFRT